MPNEIVAYKHAAGVPIAVPCSCSQKVLSNAKILRFMMISSTWRKKVRGKFEGIWSELSLKRLSKASIAVEVVMLVYIAVASAVKRRAFGGRCGSCFISSSSWFESRRYDGISGSNFFIW